MKLMNYDLITGLFGLIFIFNHLFIHNVNGDFSIRGCYGNFIVIYCEGDKRIEIIDGKWMKTTRTMGQCDLAGSVICLIGIKETKLDYYNNLLTNCDGKSKCTIQVDWTSIPHCGITDSLLVDYSCFQEVKPEPTTQEIISTSTNKQHVTDDDDHDKPDDGDDDDGDVDRERQESMIITVIVVLSVMLLLLIAFCVACFTPSVKEKLIGENKAFGKIWASLFHYDENVKIPANRPKPVGVDNESFHPCYKGAVIVKNKRLAIIQATMLPHPHEGIYEEITVDPNCDPIYNEYESLDDLSKVNGSISDYASLEPQVKTEE